MSRQITLQLATSGGQGVALPSLVRTLGTLQKVLLQIGEMHHALRPQTEEQSARSRGRFAKVIQEACEFEVIDLKVGSATAVLELAPPQPALPLFEEQDLGMLALETTWRLTQYVVEAAPWERIRELLPLDANRSLILSSYRNLCPTRGEKAQVRLWDPETPNSVCELAPQTRARVQALRAQATPDDVPRERCLIGHIRVLQARPFACTLVLEDGRNFTMPFDEEQADEYRYLWDQRVIAHTICRIIPRDDDDDTIVDIRDVVEISLVDDEALEVAAIPLEDGSLPLLDLLSVPPGFSDSLVTFEYAPLGILAHGETREEAEQAFMAELAWLWSFYAAASDDRLAPDAIELKRRLRHMVERSAA